ncbi:MAG: SGNH/GDSL hydrolase family protein [Rickettsia endosymbiont of Ixodes persulcatus]|nr:SGNH/GDSL hydrolase family protein [Rickettsia endosymbiont of Ixodes persulcatus]
MAYFTFEDRKNLYSHPTFQGSGKKKKITRVRIIGDSLSDRGIKYKKKILGCIPFYWFLDKSPHEQFTNGFVWSYSFIDELEAKRKAKSKGLNNENLAPIDGPSVFFKSKAEGGATSYNYGDFFNLFKYFKGFLMSFFLGNIQDQAKQLQAEDGFSSDDLTIIFAGANDLITAAYPNQGGAKRAVQGVINTLKIVTSSKKTLKNRGEGCKNVLLFTLPDISQVPKLQGSSEKKRSEISKACELFNREIKRLKESYRYVDFSLCDIYRVTDKTNIKLDEIKNNAIVIAGTGHTREIYFIEDKNYILKGGKALTVKKKLSKSQQKMLDKQTGKLKRSLENSELEELVQKLTTKAKLNVDIKIFDAAAFFNKVYENPEANGFTNGCAIYYYDGKEEINLENFTENAVILMPTEKANQYQLCLFQDKKVIINKDLQLSLTEAEKMELDSKLSSQEAKRKNEPIKLVGSEGNHCAWATAIIQRSVISYEKVFGEKIKLANIFIPILQAIKEKFPGREQPSWDGLHPSVILHFLLDLGAGRFFENNYEIDIPRKYSDDMAIEARKATEAKVELGLSAKSNEASELYEMPTRNRCSGG